MPFNCAALLCCLLRVRLRVLCASPETLSGLCALSFLCDLPEEDKQTDPFRCAIPGLLLCVRLSVSASKGILNLPIPSPSFCSP